MLKALHPWLFLFLLIGTISVPVSAQTDSTGGRHLPITILSGASMVSFQNFERNNYSANHVVEALVSRHLRFGLSVQAGISWTHNTNVREFSEVIGPDEFRLKYQMLEVPLLFRYDLPIPSTRFLSVSAFAGGLFSYSYKRQFTNVYNTPIEERDPWNSILGQPEGTFDMETNDITDPDRGFRVGMAVNYTFRGRWSAQVQGRHDQLWMFQGDHLNRYAVLAGMTYRL